MFRPVPEPVLRAMVSLFFPRAFLFFFSVGVATSVCLLVVSTTAGAGAAAGCTAGVSIFGFLHIVPPVLHIYRVVAGRAGGVEFDF